MKPKQQFPAMIIAALQTDRIVGISAGTGSTHRVVGIWVVVLDGQVFAQSYKLKPGGWWDTLRKEPHGEIFVSRRKADTKSARCR